MARFHNRPAFAVSRRALLGTAVSLPAAALAASAPAALLARAPFERVRPGMAGWPSRAQWDALGHAVGGRLISGAPPTLDPTQAPALLSNPFFLGDQPGLTQSSGWVDAWRSQPSVWAVRAESAADVAAAVRFAAAHRLRLVVKGGGHSYLGGSNAPDSLLVWTRGMDAIRLHDSFVPSGCDSAPVPAVSVGAGCLWLHVYQAVCVGAGRYVQGGGCTTVGVAGLVQGGGFGNFSKGFGLAAASLIEAEIVTADGQVRVVNARRDPDLFWALKGGGGGTFGIVTRLTLRTHDLPATIGGMHVAVQAKSDEAFRHLLASFLDFARASLVNPHWGEQVHATHDNRLIVDMVFQGLEPGAPRRIWQPFLDRIAARPDDWTIAEPFFALEAPGRHFWDADYLAAHLPPAISRDPRPGARPGDYWWSGDGEQAGAFWSAYTSVWLPASLLSEAGRDRLADAWFAASRHWQVTFHFNKGLAGATPEVLAASRDTAMNPEVLDAFALAIIAGDGPSAFAGLPGPDLTGARQAAERIRAADRALRAAAPGAGCYMSECDYFLADWQRASWGRHWPRLDRVKRRYDPDGLFFVRHGVGSEGWSADGFRRA
ncbi:MAG TPA: FAD-binding protein [Allosphingosinicella sp.]|nr:FAD-binding protein [Allosphingosinicella sp.]